MILWGRATSINVHKVLWMLDELGLGYERRDVGGKFGGLDTEAFGRLNPNRMIPTLVDGDHVVWESNACVRYLTARYGSGTLWPEDAALRSLSDRWMDWDTTMLGEPMRVMFWGLIRTPAEERDEAAIQAAAEAIIPRWSILESHLQERPFVGGERLTMGDVPLGCSWWRYSQLPVERPALPALERWGQRLAQSEAYKRHIMQPLS